MLFILVVVSIFNLAPFVFHYLVVVSLQTDVVIVKDRESNPNGRTKHLLH